MWLPILVFIDEMLMLTNKSSPHWPHFFNNALLQNWGMSSIMDQEIFLFVCLLCVQCQYAQVKGKKPFVYHAANKHGELNISSHEEARQRPPRLRRQWALVNRVCVILLLWCLLVNLQVLPWRPPHLTYLTRACSSESRSTLRIDVLTRLCVCLLIN